MLKICIRKRTSSSISSIFATKFMYEVIEKVRLSFLRMLTIAVLATGRGSGGRGGGVRGMGGQPDANGVGIERG